jgi:DNA-binding NarL/FixJ family response regulator
MSSDHINSESYNLSPTEIKILEYLAIGNSDKQISLKRCRSIHTTRNQIKSIYKKLNVKNRTQAAIIYHNEINNDKFSYPRYLNF